MISIVIPAYNEEKGIVDTLRRCLALKEKFSQIEVIVVDDGSSDQTYSKIKEWDVKVIKHPHNIGYGRSLKDGITQASFDCVVITDADGTYPIESIPELVNCYNHEGFDMVVGKRVGDHYNPSIGKKWLRIFLKFIVEFTTGRKIPDINSGLRVFSKKTILPYLSTLCDTFSFTTSLTLAYMLTGKFVCYRNIHYETRMGQTKVKLFKDSLRTLQYIVEAVVYYNPIKIYILCSAFLLLSAFIMFCITYVLKLQVLFLLGTGFVLCAVMMFGFGLIATQIKKIFLRL